MENNHILWASYQGLASGRTSRSIIRNNLIEWCGDALIGGGQNSHLLVENNKFLYGNWRRFNPNHEGGVSKWAFTVDSRIRNNQAAYYFGYGLWMDIANSGNVIEGNVSHDSVGGASLFTEISWDDIIRDNIAFNNSSGITIGESPGTSVRRNIVFNNQVGVRMRGNFRRAAGSNASEITDLVAFRERMAAIPDIDPIRVDQAEAQYILHWLAPNYHMTNNSVVWENLLFDNSLNYFEHRNYAERSPLDPFINNFSDHNLFFHAKPDGHVGHASGSYASFEAWQNASGRDAHSTVADPRAPSTKLPDWANAKRSLWDQKFRSHEEIRSLKLGLLDSAMSAIAIGRIMRSPTIKALPLSDPRVKAFLLEVDGQKTLGLWTSQQTERRPVRLKINQPSLTVENGYLGQSPRRLSDGVIEVVASFVPTYLRGVGEAITEVVGSRLSARPFSLPGQTIPLSAVLVNDGKTARRVEGVFSASAGFTPQPARFSRTLKPGEKVEIKVNLIPSGSFQGIAHARLDGKLGEESLTRTTAFSVGEGGGKLPFSAKAMTIDGKLDDWRSLGEAAVVGTISDASQFAKGNKTHWSGPRDLSAKLYAAWSADALYLAAEVKDDSIVPAAKGLAPWDADALEFFVDGRASEMQFAVAPSEGVFQIGVGAPRADGTHGVQVLAKSELTGFKTASIKTADGYLVEMMIPLSPRNFPAAGWQNGRTIKFSVLANDKDDPKADTRDLTFGWSFSPEGSNHNNTSGWKTLILER